MIDIKLFNKALKLSWIKKYLDTENHGKWKLLFDLHLRPFGGEAIFRGNVSKKDLAKYITISDAFTLEILQTFTDITYEGSISSIEQIKAQFFGKTLLYVLEIDQFAIDHGILRESKMYVILLEMKQAIYPFLISKNVIT